MNGLSSVDSSRLVCSSAHSLYLRATGTLVCWDDVGNRTVLQHFDPDVNYARDVFLGPTFDRIRAALERGEMPFTDLCHHCLVLRSYPNGSGPRFERDVVEVFQVEPSFRCSLDCSGCVPFRVRKLANPADLDPGILRKVVSDLAAAGVSIRAFDFQGHGEPLMHRGLWGLTRLARELFPDSYITMTTNAQGVVRAGAAASQIDEVVCSIDGVDQETFAPYRVNGRFDTAFRFMKDFAALEPPRCDRPVRVVWKYILFEHNSAPGALARLQDLAEEAAVDELVLVFTRNGPRARRLLTPADLDLRESSVPVSFRYHEPDVEDLRTRIDEASAAVDAGSFTSAVDLLLSVARNLGRFFDGERLPAPQAEMLERMSALARSLPAEERGQLLPALLRVRSA